jgi:hypothetical protein
MPRTGEGKMSKSTNQFVRPRGEDGKFLPKNQWSKADLRRFERAKRNGVFKNPVVKKKAKQRRTTKDVWIPPQDPSTGHFLPMSEWTTKELKVYEKALKKGIVPGADVRRSKDSGRFVSKSKKKRQAEKAKRIKSPELTEDLRSDIQRLERLVEAALAGDQGPEERVREIIVVPRRKPRRRVERVYVVPEEGETVGEQLSLPIDEIGAASSDACDPCQEQILRETQRVGQLCEDSLRDIRPFVRNRDLVQRRMERAVMYNPRKSLGEHFVNVIDFFKERPLLAVLGVGALVLVGYALYRAVKTIQSNFGGSSIANGVISFPGEQPYQITQDDMMWMARSIWGEVSRDPASWSTANVQRGAAAVLWAYANHYLTVGRKRAIYPTLGRFIQGYSQPVNPTWANPSSDKCRRSPAMCSSARIQFRQGLRAMPWSSFPPALTNFVEKFVAGRVGNPIGSRTDFRAAGTGLERRPDAIRVAGNVFITSEYARRPQVA